MMRAEGATEHSGKSGGDTRPLGRTYTHIHARIYTRTHTHPFIQGHPESVTGILTVVNFTLIHQVVLRNCAVRAY